MINLPIALEAEAQKLFIGWTRHFIPTDRALTYTHAETAHFLTLDDNLILAGIIDAEGTDFFMEAKTASPRSRKTWKREWLLSTQALTYGLLTGGAKRFLVRKAFKLATPEYDHEWFEFHPADMAMWHRQVHIIAQEIRTYAALGSTPWPLNFEHGCFAYGPSYPCPMWDNGCTRLNFDGPIPGAAPMSFDTYFPEFQGRNRELLLDLIEGHPNTLILSATRIKNWMRCRELYRRLETMSFPPSDAMLLGSRFHELIADWNRKLIASKVTT